MSGFQETRRIFACAVSIAAFVLVIGHLHADEQSTPRTLPWFQNQLQSEDLDAKREAAIATRIVDDSLQQQLLPTLIELLMTEKDGQVRLALLDTVTEMGPAAESAVPALVHAMQTNHGGRSNEELHRDFRAALALAAIGESAVDGLLSLLGDDRENVRAEAAMALGRIGPSAAAAVPRLLELFADEEARVRQEASIALGGIGEPALEQLLETATHSETAYRVGAITALGRLPIPDDRAASAVLKATRDEAPSVRAAAIGALMVQEVPPKAARNVLLENLRHDEEDVRAAVVNQLIQKPALLRELEPELSGLLLAGNDGVAWHAAYLLRHNGLESLPTLLEALRKDGSRIEQIADALALFGNRASARLTETMEDAEPRVRQGAALALGKIRPLSDETIQKLGAGLEDDNPQVQASVLAAIGHLGPRARQTVPAVRMKLRDDSAEIRKLAIGILFAAAPREGELLDDLSSMLEDADAGVQRRAIDAIRSLGPWGRPTLPAIVEKLSSSDSEVRIAAATMIGSHGSQAAEAVPALTLWLDSSSPEMRLAGARTLGELGAASRPAFDKLTRLLKDADVEVRVATIRTLGNLDLEPEELRPHFARALQDEESDVRYSALRGIRRFGRKSTIFLPNLIALAAGDGEGRYLRRAFSRFERYGTDPRSIPELVAQLKHEHQAVRLLAVKFLGLAGTEAKEVIPELEQLAEDPDEEVRAAVPTAIARIQGQPVAEDDES